MSEASIRLKYSKHANWRLETAGRRGWFTKGPVSLARRRDPAARLIEMGMW